MKLIFTKNMSRLRKKLLLYFLLVSIVSISVSAEIILEVSSPVFKHKIENNFYNQLIKDIPVDKAIEIMARIDDEDVFYPIYDLRNRTILLLLVIFITIVGALFLFTKDIVDPLDEMVTATKKIVNGDLTVKVPVTTPDEIGQVAGLINDLNDMFSDMIINIKNDLNRHKITISIAVLFIKQMIESGKNDNAGGPGGADVTYGNQAAKTGKDVVNLLDNLLRDLALLETFIGKYKIFSLKRELSQDEIENALKKYKDDENT